MKHDELERSHAAVDTLRIDDVLVDPTTGRIHGNGRVEHLEPRVMAVLRCLARTPGRTVARRRLLAAGWPEGWTSEEALTKAISELRKALGDDPRDPAYVETIPKIGYRLVADVGDDGERGGRAVERPRRDPRRGWRRPVLAVAAGLLLLGSAEWYGHVVDPPDPEPRRVRIRRVLAPGGASEVPAAYPAETRDRRSSIPDA